MVEVGGANLAPFPLPLPPYLCQELGGMKDLEHSVYGLDYHQRSNTIAVAAGNKLYSSVVLGSTLQALHSRDH